MTREESVFVAHKLFAELVFNTAYIEKVNVSFPQVQAILDGAIVNNVPVSDIETVLNLKDAWHFALKSLDTPLTLGYLCQMNEQVSRNKSLTWGVLRNRAVNISRTTYTPPVPQQEAVQKELERIASISGAQERALEAFCYLARAQLFWDGNKRVATIVASKIMIEAGAGVLTIGKAKAREFNETLLCYYDTADNGPLKQCLMGCIKTMQRNPAPVQRIEPPMFEP
jgi:Fic family protein